MKQIQQLRRITIWGVGLIGGSLGLALKKNGFHGQRVGLGRNIDRLENARHHDAVDTVTTEVTEGLRGSDLVVLCTPVELVPGLVRHIVEAVDGQQHQTVVTDVGSTKSVLVRRVDAQLREQRSEALSFVGAHPMAGSHETGVDAARATLFENAPCIMTPTESTEPGSLQLVRNLWEFVGGVPQYLTPETHDLLIGAASHLPHLMASLLTHTVANVETEHHKALDFTATGFRDSTRIAAGSPNLWTGIFSQNRNVLLSLIDDIVGNLIEFRTLLQTEDLVEIERVLLEAQAIVEKRRETLGGS